MNIIGGRYDESVNNGEIYTTSMAIAMEFKKDHEQVLKDIRDLYKEGIALPQLKRVEHSSIFHDYYFLLNEKDCEVIRDIYMDERFEENFGEKGKWAIKKIWFIDENGKEIG